MKKKLLLKAVKLAVLVTGTAAAVSYVRNREHYSVNKIGNIFVCSFHKGPKTGYGISTDNNDAVSIAKNNIK